ncbi:MAG TPA: ion channel [Cytophagaceae bacterium]|jgi:inward rectifier potassium channel|nr:ion channel [Cytophagaceae bacterium]
MKRILSKKIKADNDTGFANQANTQGGRILNKDGSLNVIRTGLPLFERLNFFHDLIAMNWLRFSLIVLSFYILMNLFFGLIYYVIGVEHLNGTLADNEWNKFLESFFFSTQTFATVGYGRINPTGILTNIVSSLEALMGVLSLALVTSLLYSRFSKPKSKLLYSKNLLVAPYQDASALMFRFANSDNEPLLECEIQLILSMMVKENEKDERKYFPLKLERDKIASLAMNWTVVHPLNEDSPMFGCSMQDMIDYDAEFIVLLKAFDNTYSQIVHTRSSYKYNDIVWGGKFKPMFYRAKNGSSTVLELDKISDYELVKIPEFNPTVSL